MGGRGREEVIERFKMKERKRGVRGRCMSGCWSDVEWGFVERRR